MAKDYTMTIEKIMHYIGEDLYNHWAECTSLLHINEAAKTLRAEIEAGILTDIKYHAELRLLEMRINSATPYKQPVISRQEAHTNAITEQLTTLEN